MVALFLKIYLFLCLYLGAALHRSWDFSSQPRIGARASLVAEMVKNLPAMWETWVQSLGQEDPWRREWQPTLVFLPGEFHRQRSLLGYSQMCCKELDMTE